MVRPTASKHRSKVSAHNMMPAIAARPSISESIHFKRFGIGELSDKLLAISIGTDVMCPFQFSTRV
jgi:hypothetical protein